MEDYLGRWEDEMLEEIWKRDGHTFLDPDPVPMDANSLFDYKLLAGIPIFDWE